MNYTTENFTSQLIKGLNSPQQQAVEYLQGPLLILAGAGSGKTRVLTHRMANMIAQGHAAPDEVLAVTFTNKAAKEMEARVFKILSDLRYGIREPLWVSTFHSFCNRILRRHIEMLDYKSTFVIYDDGDQLSLIKKVMVALNINEKVHPAKNFRHRINHAKMLALSPHEAGKSKAFFMDHKSVEVYAAYEEAMKRANAVDFGDLMLKVLDLFKMYPDLLSQYQKKFKFIMVDEYQDTNHVQYLLVRMLAGGHRNLCVVGDEDQSIYSWRGADIRNILDFEKDFPEAKIIKLEENYRSTKNIITGASAVIANNTERKEKTLFTNNEAGDLIHAHEERNEYDEARFVTKKIQSLVAETDATYSDFAIFYRTNAQSRVLEEQLRMNDVPYKLVGGVRFYERMEIKDVLAYLKTVLNPSDDISVKRIINVPARGIGKTTVEKIDEISIEKKISFYESIKVAVDQRQFNAGTTSKLRQFILLLEDLQKSNTEHNLLDFYHLVLEKTGYVNALKVEDTSEAESRVQNLEELSNAIGQFLKERAEATLQTFLEEMALVSDIDSVDTNMNGVTLMTLHVSKGLEFPYVFIVGMEENLFPSARSSQEDDGSSIEEERRLAYVGMTRAEKKLFLTYTRTRKVWGQEQFNPPSRFINEIPNHLVSTSSSVSAPKFSDRYSGYASSMNSSESYAKTKNFDDDFTQDFPDYEESSSSGYKKGMRIRHPTFGLGSIFEVEGAGDNMKLSVLFTDQTIKKFVAKYARLEKL